MTDLGIAQVKNFGKYEARGAYHWEWYANNLHQYKDKIHLVLAHLPVTGSVIDVGGGDGLLSYHLFANGLNVTCIDSNALSITLAKRMIMNRVYGVGLNGSFRKLLSQYNIKTSRLITRFRNGEMSFVAQSFDEFNTSKSFDYAVCHEVIEHVPDPENLLKWIMKNITKYAIISTPDVTYRQPHELDYNSWTPDSFAAFLQPYKFEYILLNGRDIYAKVYK